MGDYRLLLGDPSGATILPAAKRADLSPLAHALVEEGGQRGSAPNAVDRFEGAVGDASQVTGKVERATTLFKEVSQGRLDPASVSNEVDALVGLLRKLDHEERFEDVLRVAHSLATLLSLTERWLELLRSLQSALGAAERIGDTASKAWALHELGTLSLAAERQADADRMLSEAHNLRRQVGDTHGLAVTERNLQILCHRLRAQLHHKPQRSLWERLVHRPVIALLLAVLLVIVGGVAGAATRNSHSSAHSVGAHPPSVTIEIAPSSPVVGRPVAFHASVEGGADPVEYLWHFGDRHISRLVNPTHVYRHAGTYTVTVVVIGVHGVAASKRREVAVADEAKSSKTPGKPGKGSTGPQSTRPTIDSASATTFEEGAEGRFTVEATGTPTPTIAETGKLPEGVTFNGGVLGGVATTAGSFPIVFTATNSVGSFQQEFTLIVDPGASTTPEETVPGTPRKPETPPP